MTDVICPKCGTNIPTIAKFCPNCGTIKPIEAPAVPKPQPVQPQPVQPLPPQPKPINSPSRSMNGSFDTLFSNNFILLGTLIGILLAWIGRNIMAYTFGMANSFGQSLQALGFFAIGIFLIGGGIINKNLDKYIKLGMIIGGSIVVAMGL